MNEGKPGGRSIRRQEALAGDVYGFQSREDWLQLTDGFENGLTVETARFRDTTGAL